MSSSAMRGSSASSCETACSTATTRVEVGGGTSRQPASSRATRVRVDQRARQRRVQRRQRDRAVGHHLDRGAALAEQDDRAEQRVDAGADDQLLRLRPAHHRLDREAGERGVRALAGHAPQHAGRGLAQRGVVARGPARRRRRRSCARSAATGSSARPGSRSPAPRARRRRHRGATTRVPTTGMPQAASKCLGFGLAEHLAALGQHRIDERTHARQVERRLRAHAPAAPPSAAPGCGGRSTSMRERAHRLLRACRSSGCRRRGRCARASCTAGVAEPAAQHAPGAACATGTSAAAISALGTMAVGACMNSSVPLAAVGQQRLQASARSARPARRR